VLDAPPILTDTVHLSGTPRVTLRIASSKAAANLSMWRARERSSRSTSHIRHSRFRLSADRRH
jgi:hypothetical protein